jgi:hypothetical protein
LLREDEEEEKKTKQDQFPLISFTSRQIKHVNNENIFFSPTLRFHRHLHQMFDNEDEMIDSN